MSLTKKNRPIGPKEIKNENPEIKQTPEIIRVIQFRQIGGNLAKAWSAKSRTCWELQDILTPDIFNSKTQPHKFFNRQFWVEKYVFEKSSNPKAQIMVDEFTIKKSGFKPHY